VRWYLAQIDRQVAGKAQELRREVEEAIKGGAVPLRRGASAAGRFLDGQDTSAYVVPTVLLASPGRSRLRHAEPFGPVDTIIVVDTEDELLSAMNASNGALVASLAVATAAGPRSPSGRTAAATRPRCEAGAGEHWSPWPEP
jgi:acyl-CoA reductase-like NAD-dependent aldehyde dehydrogenase